MTIVTDPPAGQFRLSMLLSDTRYRSLHFKPSLHRTGVGLLVFGKQRRSQPCGPGPGHQFRLFGQPAGYDINQRLIEYDSQSSNLRAAIVGILNTLLVAVLACATATVFRGFGGGFAPVQQLARVQVDGFLRGDFPQHSRSDLDPDHIHNHDGRAAGPTRLLAVMNPKPVCCSTLLRSQTAAFTPAALLSNAASGAARLFAGFGAFGRIVFRSARRDARATRIQEATGERSGHIADEPRDLVRASDCCVFDPGLSFELPALKGFNFKGGITIRGSLIALWFALSIYTGAFIAENVRAGIQAVSKGQTEAAARIGLRPGRT